MQPEVVFGNARVEGASRWGWFVGHFITPTEDLRSTPDVEVKWAVQKAGDERNEWAMNAQATTLAILISGKFRLKFPEQEILLSSQGDYVLWLPGVSHCWSAESDCTILTVRWPSQPGDSVATTS